MTGASRSAQTLDCRGLLSTELIIGGLLVGFGLYSLVARFVAPHHLGKLEPMKGCGRKGGLGDARCRLHGVASHRRRSYGL